MLNKAERYDLQLEIWESYYIATGTKPRWMDFDAMSDAELESEAESWGKSADAELVEQAEREAEYIKEFEAKVTELIEMGAGHRDTAIQWLRDAEQDEQALWDDDYFAYYNGLPYGYFKKAA